MASQFSTSWIKKYLNKKPNIILDVGSYDGNDAKRFKEKYPNCRVIAIEASEKNFKRMEGFEFLEDIEIYRFAVCDKDGKITFNDTLGSLTGSGSIFKPNNFITDREGVKLKKEIVNSTRLDTFCKSKGIKEIDFLHMDLQGAENEALIGLGNLRPKLIFLESGGSTINCYEGTTPPREKLISMGYKLIKYLGGDQLWLK